MGILESAGGRRIVLPAHTLIGRQRTCFLVLEGGNTSGEHAAISWLGSHWSIRDLGSRNGTILDDQRLNPATVLPLRAGSRIVFGDVAETWTLVDESPPEPMAINLLSREVRVGHGGMLALPDDERPLAVLYESGGPGRWVLEQDQEVRPVEGSSVNLVAVAPWVAFLPTTNELTPHQDGALSVATSTFCFFVSKNEEHVRLVVQQGRTKTTFEAREHYYLLLVLARRRLADRERAPEERGWVSRDELVRQLHADVNSIDVSIHRNRRRLEEANVLGAAGVVEVRRGERRFGADHIEIILE